MGQLSSQQKRIDIQQRSNKQRKKTVLSCIGHSNVDIGNMKYFVDVHTVHTHTDTYI